MLYFPQIEPNGDRSNKDGGNFEYGAFGEGGVQSSRGWRVKTTGEGASDYKVIRPRLAIPVQDDQRFIAQARVLSNVSTTQNFRGVGMQIRAFNYTDGPVKEAWRNQIDSDQNLWIRQPDPNRWQYLTQSVQIPENAGADAFVPELLIIGQNGGFCDVSMFGARTAHASLGTFFNAGPDVRAVQFDPFVDEAYLTVPISLSPGQDFRVIVTSDLKIDQDAPALRWLASLRRVSGGEDRWWMGEDHRAPTTAGIAALNGSLEINSTRDYDQLQLILRGFSASNVGNRTVEVTDLRTDWRELDVVRSVAQ